MLRTLVKPDASNTIYGISGYVPTAIVLMLLVLSYYLLKNNHHLKKRSNQPFALLSAM